MLLLAAGFDGTVMFASVGEEETFWSLVNVTSTAANASLTSACKKDIGKWAPFPLLCGLVDRVEGLTGGGVVTGANGTRRGALPSEESLFVVSLFLVGEFGGGSALAT